MGRVAGKIAFVTGAASGIAEAGVIYLASDESKIVTGAVLAADGGYSIA